MKKTLGKMLSLLMGGVLLLTAAGCGNQGEGSIRDVSDGTAETTVTTKEPRKVEVQTGEVGEEVSVQDVYVTVDKAYLPSYTFTDDDQEIGIIFFLITIRNESDRSISANMLSRSYAIETDGEAYPGVTVRGTRFIYRQFGEGTEDFSDPIASGETRQGYICLEVPADFQVATLMYFPGAGVLDWSEAYTFKIPRSEMEPAPDPVMPF
ncbi:MAG: DUF4352 domain-containing protein [Ruminococcus sp.]